MLRRALQFIHVEALSGILLLIAALLALLIDNSPWHHLYETFFRSEFHVGYSHWQFRMTLLECINHGLMTLFFLLVGLEVKREIVQGELNSIRKVALPSIAAAGGMVIPAFIYSLLNHHDPIALRGWAVPCATDIAFALGVLNLLHGRISASLKIFLTALAIFDDIGAIIIIAIFYSLKVSWFNLGLAFICLLALILLNRFTVRKLWPYLCFGLLLWFFTLQSGIDAVIAGVILALTIPMTVAGSTYSPLVYLEKKLHPWSAFLILPLFAFANAGVSFIGVPVSDLFNWVTWGVILGLFFGKQIGVFLTTWLAIKSGWATMLPNADWKSIYGVAVVCGVGFTMSLFIGTLAFAGNHYLPAMRLGVICGSLLSGIAGFLILSVKKIEISN